MNRTWIVFRFLLIGILLLAISYQFGGLFIKACIPIYQWEIQLLDSRLHMTFFDVIDINGQRLLQLNVSLNEPFLMGLDYVVPDSPMHSTVGMPIGNILLPLVLFLTISLSWPVKASIEYLYRLATGIPLIALVMMSDIPIQFVTMVWEGIQQGLSSVALQKGIFSYWSNFLNGGGLIALGLTSGLIAVGCADYFIKRHAPNGL